MAEQAWLAGNCQSSRTAELFVSLPIGKCFVRLGQRCGCFGLAARPDVLAREGTALYDFVGLELGVHAITLVLLHTVIKTGLTEEILFRGLIAGSISRRLPAFWANITQALIFVSA